MVVAKNGDHNESSTEPCSCFQASALDNPLLDSHQIANLKERYVLSEQLGWGQFGIIRLCTDKISGDVLACKSIAKERLRTVEDVNSVKLEIEILSRLCRHPNVVDLKAVYEDEDYVHLVMELCAGGELFHHLEKHGKYTEEEAKDIFKHLMEVVLYCHDNGVVHRDLKPENILLSTKDSVSPIKLADFGLATYIKPGQSIHGTVGSPFYIAPEVLSGGYTEAADIWSAGVILYILLSGVPPFWGKTKSRIFDAVRAADLRFSSKHWDRISESAHDLIKGMLCKDPLRRLTAQQVLDHPWTVERSTVVDEPTERQTFIRGELDNDEGSFSTPIMPRNQDISFGTTSPLIWEPPSPYLTCRSSFSTFLIKTSTPRTIPGSIFVFPGATEPSTTVDYASPLPSMPSFAFFSPGTMVEQEIVSVDLPVDIATSPDAVIIGHDASDIKCMAVESKSFGAGSRLPSIHNKRNRTIGFGEFSQLELAVTDSVIRWVSCTNLPTCPSLQPSLVC